MLIDYFAKIEENINLFQDIIDSFSTTTKYYNRYKGFVSGDILFIDGSHLSFKEVKDVGFQNKFKYSYHYMGSDNIIIFRFDNAYHHPEIKTFPHHKHLLNEIADSIEPDLIDILNEISELLLNE
jgi:hypothetical protein